MVGLRVKMMKTESTEAGTVAVAVAVDIRL
jgi:hypothetical protein